ncbi:cytochrome c-type biogenesis protein CcsB [Pseudonocardia thermophila]|jgi:cytochrome c-type biogenesis protein CcsB|uniref:Cytochrome c-type biogenesis protein CcsB n=1 Tax=Pseudonocardia thermophila TaxID=1848 RepID=A0A1M6Y919_PSETH|nr:c-type cytochrome biogenesis protein CcsB [Pseudonocardia thermophila]SHL14796.1 cytochrome c-type biogenesis protein CcsB [Pseudonocardia thermophila]
MLAQYSDWFYIAAVAVYVLAMVLHAYAQAAVRTRRPVLVGAGGTPADIPAAEEQPARAVGARAANMGVSVAVLGALLHLASIVARGLATERWPLGNMYEFISMITFAAVVTWLVMLRRVPAARSAAPWVLLPIVVLMTLGGTALYTAAGPVMPALRSYWLPVHVTAIAISSGLLIVSGVASILFLLRSGSGVPAAIAERMPTADVLDRVAYRVMIVAFPLYTFAVVAGAVWAEAAWGRFWGWDPKETVAFVAWVIYAAYLHARATAGWRTGRAAWINIAGLTTMIFNLFFINLVVAGLHSYAGVG